MISPSMSSVTMRRRRVLAVLMALVPLAVIVHSAKLTPVTLAAEDLGFLLGISTTLVVGMYLVLRRPDNPIGLILEGFGASFTLGSSADVIAASTSPIAQMSAWLSTWQWALGLVLLLVLLPLLFPEGRLPSPGFRWVIPTALVGLALIVLGNAFRETTTIDAPSGEVVVDLPFSLPWPTQVFDIFQMVGMICAVAAVVGAAAGVVTRFRRSTGLERQQMKVFGTGLVAAVILVGVNLFLYSFGLASVANVLFTLAIVAIVGSIAVAVLRYRLYDLGTVISRTITYSIVAVLVAMVYAVGAVWLPARVVGGQSPLFVAGSTLVVAAMFTPTRRKVMRWVDRRFNRSRYQAEGILEQFTASLQVRHLTEEIMSGWLDLVSNTLQPAAIGLWIRSSDTDLPPDTPRVPSTSVAPLPER